MSESAASTFTPRHGPGVDLEKLVSTEKHKGGGTEYVKSIVYGGLDGVVSILVSVASVYGSPVGIKFILALGAAKLAAGAFSMGIGDFLSTKAEVDFIVRERLREEWEVDNYIEGERAEMIEIYVNYGLSKQAATEVVEIISKNKQTFVNTMMVEELGLNPEDIDQSPLKHGLVNFGSFLLFGILPLLVYIAFAIDGNEDDNLAFAISAGMTGFGLLSLGVGKAFFTGTPYISSTLMTLLCGCASGAVGFGIAYAFRGESV
ncbi:integral membrane protein [Capsaspora owczarzaki ATCC 30864]|uniref:Integral membrane protein, variant n=1 Tax=Capsaspora owczarzaki (strain ATCC 30864) TaxID=595528 RepID=A0A0D2WL68_CAPO3|nr:integral membrane protein [Capsaspora owczarzaki ATCC 30864]KJE91245.1 integral membrane protein, variant [Capsaspora owczarzaki ATCC 30864]|eukprot:XP_004349158.1 integral membrane protein [Capsaspora owczarzaki ATCC 30864]